jgi:enoyl-CoA hydratase
MRCGSSAPVRVAPAGESRAAAHALADQLARLPALCMRNDRMSLLEQDEHDEAGAMSNELQHGLRSLAEMRAGLERYRTGAGRHGSFEKPD